MQGIPHGYFVSSSIFSFLLSQQDTKWWRRGQIISSTIPSAECYRNFLRPRKHNVPSCSGAPPELGTAPNFLPSTKPAPPSPPPTTPPSTCHPLPPLRQSHIPGKFSRLCWHQNRAIPFKMDIGEIFPLICTNYVPWSYELLILKILQNMSLYNSAPNTSTYDFMFATKGNL